MLTNRDVGDCLKMKVLLYIFIGGGVGSVLRYAVQCLLHNHTQAHGFPWATFIVNVAGCFLIGMLYSLSERWSLSMEARLFLTAGLCGGFTTFSTFANDGVELLRNGNIGLMILYLTLSVALGLLSVIAGNAVLK